MIIFIYPKIKQIEIKYLGMIIYLIQILSLISTSLINPGIPHRSNYLSESIITVLSNSMKLSELKFRKYKVCKVCNILVNSYDEVIHCEDCGICIKSKINFFFTINF